MACYGCARLGVAKANSRNEIYDHHERIFVENGRQQSTEGVRFVNRNIPMKKILTLAAAMFAALTPAFADVAITPTEIPVATQQVHYAQNFSTTGASGAGGLSWSTVAWKVESAASTYAVGANDTPLWDGAQTFYTNIVYTLPFAFPYRDQSFTNLYISAGGILFFTSGRSAFDYSVGYYYYLYNALVPFWMEEAENVEGYVDTSVANEVSFRFAADYTNASEVACKFAYRVTLKSDGTIRYSYRQDAGDTIGDSVRAVGLSYYDTVHSSRATLPVGEESDGIPTCDYVFTTYTGYPDGFTFQGNYDYSSDLYYPTATLSGQTSEFGTWTFGVSVYDAGTSTATTNYYTLTVAENPDKPPVFDAFTPADTNTVRALAIGDTLNFHVEASDPKGGPFDITWTFLDADVESPVKRTLGTGADLTFVASNELYEIQRWGGSSVVKCTISDAYWTNSITWHVYISKEFYLDPAADPGAADGSVEHPWTKFPEPGLALCKGDTLNLVPGVYVIDDDSLGFPGGVTIRTTGSSADTKIVYPDGDGFFQGQNDHLKIANITVEGIRFQNADLEDCTIIGVQSPSYCFDDCSFTRCYVTGNSTTKEYLFRDSTLEDCTVAGNTIGYSASDDYFTGYTAIGPDCQLVRSIVVNNLTLDGDEANWADQEYWGIAATNCCTIPAMTDYGPGNIEAQPTFVSLEGYDARLRVGSACIADNPANNIGAYKGAGVEGFAVLATTDPVRGTVAFSGDVDFKSPHATHIVASGGSVTVTATAVTNRVFKNWIVNGEEGATTPTLTLNDITADMEVEAVFEVKEFYVNPTEADDTGDGSAAAPKKTIAAAAALALDGETIRLAEGSYEPFALTGSLKLTLLGAGAGRTVIDGGFTNTCVVLGSNMTLKNASVINGSAKNYAGGVYGGTIENCVVSNCASRSFSNCYAGGVCNATIISSLIANNVQTNHIYGGYAAGVKSCKVYNSTIANNTTSGSSDCPGGAYGSYLKNCIVYSNGNRQIDNCYNEKFNNSISTNIVAESNLIGVDPWFIDAANGDYRLTAGSPAIDAGENVPQVSYAGALDLAGDRRVRGAAVDYGCYEGGIVTGAPAAPVATGTSAKAAKGIPFAWEAVPNAAQYRIYRGTTDDPAAATLLGSTTATNYLDLATTGGTDYFYWISAWNSQYDESEKCGPIAVTSYADLKIETASFPAATEAVPYSVQLECSGNVGAATWSLPYAFVTRETNTFAAATGVLVDDDWPTKDKSYQHNPIIELPFTFTWFGTPYDVIRLSEHGAIAFGDTGNSLSWSYSAIDETPKIAVLEGVSGWGDYTTISEIRVDSQSDYVKISWKGKSDGYLAEFSATLYPDNTVRLSYGSCRGGGYIAYSNGSDESAVEILRVREDFSNMDDVLITCLPNESHLALSEGGLLSGIEDDAGEYLVSVLVTDADNGDAAWKTFALTVNANANKRPVIDAVTPDADEVLVLAGDSQEFTVTAHDPESAALSYSWYLDDALVSTAGANWTYAPTDADRGRHSLVCEVADALWTNGQVYAEWEVSVAQKLYVDAVNGTTNGTGTAESPFKTLQQAEGWISGGETVFVAPGTYAPVRVWGGGMPDPVTFCATGSAAETIIDGGSTNICVDDYHCSKNFTFVGFTLRNGGDEDYAGTASYGVNLKDCVVTGCKSWRCTIYGANVENCQIYGNTALRHGAAVGFCKVVNSLIYGNTSGETGVVYRSTLERCTVYGNTAMVGGGLDATSTADHSIVWGNTATADASTANYQPGTNDVQFTYSCTTPLPSGDGNIASDPLFVNAAGGDFHLADSSPCLAAGMGCYAEGGGEPVVVNYTVTFNANGGTCATATRSVQSGKAVGTLPTATRSGYTLAGWYTAASGGTQVTASTVVTKDVTYYAHWTAIPKYTVTFNANGGTSAESSRQVEKGKAIGTLPTATRTGYTLAGWYTAASGGTQVTASTVVTAAITVYAHWTENAPAYTLTIENGVLKGYTGTLPATLEIPATVTAFAANLFKGVTALKAATGGANVVKCGAGAFRDSGIWNAAANGPVVVCGVLVGYKGTVPATVDVPYGVKVIADGAFAGASNLVTVYLPDSLVSIGEGAFKDCSNLDNVNGLESGVTVASDAFEGTLYATFRLTYDSSGTTVTGFKGQLPAALVLPAKVIGVGVGVFKNQAAITSLKIEGTNSVNLGSSAFEGCTKLATVSVGGSPSIAATTFKGCTALKTLTVGGSATIAASAFQTCTALKTVSAAGGATIGASAFEGCAALNTFTAGGTASIAANAFKGCTALRTADFGEVSTLGDGAFEGCSLLAAFELPEGIEEIGAATFKGCASLETINLPASVTTIGASAFEGCSKLTTVTGGENVRILRTDAFAGTPWYDTAPAGAFEEVILGHVLLRVKGEVPASYEISSNVWMVANNAFEGVTTLTNLYIGTEVVSLWDRAFAGCTSLGSVTIPSGCREFGDYLFDGCSSLSKVFFRGHAPTNDVPHVFAGTPETLKVRIKEGSRGWVYPGADSDYRPARWPYQTTAGRYGWQRVADDLNRAVYDPDDEPGVVRSVIVGGNITNDTTWVGGRVYEVQSTCTVREGATLTIEKGAIVKMQRHQTETFFGWFVGSSDMRVEGHLQINGTKANPVVFTSSTDDTWGGDTNGDGNRSEPYPGECSGVKVQGSGSVEARYAKFLYGNAANAYNAHACVMDYGHGSYYYGCEFSHSAMDGFFGGGRLENCVFTDCDRGIVSTDKDIAAVNCVAYGNRVGFWRHTSSMYITNCIAAFNSEYGISGDGGVNSTRCCLWNPDGQNSKFSGGSQYYKLEVENIEADPLFLDAENGDFRISTESPCVDAAYGDVAPEYDYYEQPRMDVKFARNTGTPNAEGVYPDIGIYEVPGSTTRLLMNLEVESVSFSPASVAPGEWLTVSYKVKNAGDAAAKGSIRDVVRIKSAANGGTMTAGTVTQNYALEAGAEAVFTARVATPAAPAGEWLVGIDVNPNRDVFEQNLQKNTLWTEDAVEVKLPAMKVGSSTETIPAGVAKGWELADLPAEGGVVTISGSGAAAIRAMAANGHMPTVAMNDAVSFAQDAATVVLVVPPHAAGETMYLAIENTGISSATVTVKVEKLTTQLWSVYPEIAANVGDMGFTFTGAGLTATSDIRLGGIKAKSVTVVDSANVYAVFDIHNIAADRYYDVTADGKTLRDAVYINKKALGPVLEAKLELPERTRDNRVYTGYVVYENKGDTQMNAPTFIINYADSDTNTVFGAYDDDNDNLTQQRVLIIGLGASNPAGVLKPGDSGRLPFKFKPVGGFRFKLDSRYTSDEVADAATRLNLRGKLKFDGYTIRGLASLIKKGEMAAAVSGHFLDSRTREPLANAALKLTLQGSGAEPFTRVVTTDDDGYFSFDQLKDGVYTLVADKGYALATTNAITVAGQADVNGYEATAIPPGVVSGYVMGDDGTVVQYGDVTLFRSASDMAGETVRTDGYGAYRFTGLDDGEYSVFAKPYESFKGQLATNLVVSTAARERRLDFELRKTVRAFGTVTTWKGGTVENGEVRFYQEDGGFLKVDVSTNGTWEAAGVEPGKYSVAYISTDGKYDSANASVSLAAGDATEIPLVSQPATPFRTSTTFGVIDASRPTLTVYFAATGYANDTNIASVVWRFGDEGGKTYETNSVEIVHDYTSVGEFTVSTQPRYVDGTLGDEFEIENCIMVTNELETIYKDNAIVLGGYMPDDANFKTNAGTLAVVGVGDDWVKLTGSPAGVPLAAGSVIAGTYKDADGEDDWFLRRIVGVTGDATSGWTLKTEHGNETDLYVQYWSYWSASATELEKPPVQANVSSNGGRKLAKLSNAGETAVNLLKKVSGSIEKGIEFEVECSPDLHYHYSCTILTSYWRKVIKTIRREDFTVWELYSPARRELSIFGDVSIKADITATASFGGSWDDEQEYDLVPTAYKTIPSAAKAYPYFKIGYAASGSIEGSVTASAEIKGYLDIGFVKEDEKDIVWHKSKPFTGDVDISFDAQEGIDANIKLEASVSAGLGVKVKAFEVVTAKADVTFNAKASVECPKNSPSKAGVSIGYDTNVSMNFIDLTWLNKNWKVGMDWTIEGLTLWSQEWISAKPKFIYRQPHAKEWPARITVTDRSERGTYADARGRTFPIPIRSVHWDYGQGQTFDYSQAQIDSGEYKKHRIIEFPGDQDEGEYTVSLNVQGGLAPSLWPYQKKIKIKKPEEDEREEQTKIFKDEWFGEHVSTQKSVDPNEMVGPEGNGPERYVKPGEWMTYTVYFENKAEAGVAAQEVFVDNPLSEHLDWSTFEMGEVSVAGQIDYGLVGAVSGVSEMWQENGLYKTRTTVDYDSTAGVISWYMRVVDPAKTDGEQWPDDPDVGILQPNVAPPEGEGYITYRVRVLENAPGNAVIDNSASIVFDYNLPIVTDPAWWNTVYETESIPVTIDGVTTNMTFVVGEPYGELPTPKAKPGYTFDGWWTGANGTGRRVTPETIVQSGDRLYANWVKDADPEPVWTVTFDANGGTLDGAATVNVTNGQSIGEMPVAVREHYSFVGWFTAKSGGEQVIGSQAITSDLALYAHWGAEPYLYEEPPASVAPTAAAAEYNGYLVDAAGALKGTIQVKVGKPNKKTGLAAVKATVVPAVGKKVSLKGAEKGKAAISADGPTEIALTGGEACTVVLGESALAGSYGAYAIKGSRNFFSSKNKAEQSMANALVDKWIGAVNAVWSDGSISVAVAKKGKTKSTVLLSDGTKGTANGVLLVGEEWCCIPIVVTKKVSLSVIFWLPYDGGDVLVTGLDGAIVGRPGNLASGTKFYVDRDDALWSQISGKVLTDYLPDQMSVGQNKGRWTFPKAGKLSMKKGVLDDSKAGENPSGLKLTFKSKDGSFSGSFKVYAEQSGKLKSTTVNVTGMVLNGKGYGTATIKKVGSMDITIE